MNKALLIITLGATLAGTPSIQAQTGERPAAAEEMVMTFDYNNGNPVVRGSLKAPTMTGSFSDPKPLESIGRIEVTRSCSSIQEYEEPVYSVSNPAPGAVLTFTDNTIEEFGYQYTYTATVYSPENLNSSGTYQMIFVGVKPAKPEFVSVETKGDKGAAPVEFSIKAPSATADGAELPIPLTKIVLSHYKSYYEQPELHVFENPEPGQTYTWSHDDAENGTQYDYRLTAYTALGASDYSSSIVYIGEDVPAKPVDLSATETEEGVALTWTAPAAGLKNGYFDPANTLYKVERITDTGTTTVKEGLDVTQWTDKLEGIDHPVSVNWKVTAYNAIGNGGYMSTNSLVVGPACALPFEENFNEGSYYTKLPRYTWTIEPEGWGGNWSYGDYYYSIDGLTGADGDSDNREGFAYCSHSGYTGAGTHDYLISSKINLKEAKYPVLSFHYAAFKDADNRLAVELRHEGAGEDPVADFSITENAPADAEFAWTNRNIPIETAKGNEAVVVFHAYTSDDKSKTNNKLICIDKVTVDDYPYVEEINCEVTEGVAHIEWKAPTNGRKTADSYDVTVNDAEPVSTSSCEYAVPVEQGKQYTISVRANYGDIKSKYSQPAEFSAQTGLSGITAGGAFATGYYDASGRKVTAPAEGDFVIRRSVMPDGSVRMEKLIYNK